LRQNAYIALLLILSIHEETYPFFEVATLHAQISNTHSLKTLERSHNAELLKFPYDTCAFVALFTRPLNFHQFSPSS